MGVWAFGIVGRDAVDEECMDGADSLESDIVRRLVGRDSNRWKITGNVLSRRAVMVLCLAGLIWKCVIQVAWVRVRNR